MSKAIKLSELKNLNLEELRKLNTYLCRIIEVKIAERNLEACGRFPVGGYAAFTDKSGVVHFLQITKMNLKTAKGKEFKNGKFTNTIWKVSPNMLCETAARPTE